MREHTYRVLQLRKENYVKLNKCVHVYILFKSVITINIIGSVSYKTKLNACGKNSVFSQPITGVTLGIYGMFLFREVFSPKNLVKAQDQSSLDEQCHPRSISEDSTFYTNTGILIFPETCSIIKLKK